MAAVAEKPNIRALQIASLAAAGIHPDAPFLRTAAADHLLGKHQSDASWITKYARDTAAGQRPSDSATRAIDAAFSMSAIANHPIQLCRQIVEANGESSAGRNELDIVTRALSSVAGQALFSTNINGRILSSFMSAPDTTGWASTIDVANFQTFEVHQRGTTSRLRKQGRGAAPEQTTAPVKEPQKKKLATYSARFELTREDLMDDAFGSLSKIPEEIGKSAVETKCDLVYSTLLQNPNMADGQPAFQAGVNLLTGLGVVSSGSIDTARITMANRLDENGRHIGETPQMAVCGQTKLFDFKRVLNSVEERNPAATTDRGTANPALGLFNVIGESRIDLGAWDPDTEKMIAGNPGAFFLSSGSDHGLVIAHLAADSRAPIVDEYRLTDGRIGFGWSIQYAVAVVIAGRLGLLRAEL